MVKSTPNSLTGAWAGSAPDPVRGRDLLRAIRTDHLGWTQGRLAGAAGVSESIVSQVANGVAPLTENMAWRFVRVFDEQGVDPQAVSAFARAAGIDRREGPVPREVESYRVGVKAPPTETPPDDNERAGEWHSDRMEWRRAEFRFLAAAKLAAARGDRTAWTHLLTRASLMAMSLGDFAPARARLDEVIRGRPTEVGALARVDAVAALGWILFEQGAFGPAQARLRDAVDLATRHYADGRAPEFGTSLMGALHFLGRTLIEGGPEGTDPLRPRYGIDEGLRALGRSADLASQLGIPTTVGYNLLRGIPARLDRTEVAELRRQLDESRELLGHTGTGRGHYHLHEAMILGRAGDAARRRSAVERAVAGYVDPVFYPIGHARASRELAVLELRATTSGSDEAVRDALARTLAAAILHPYGANLSTLRVMAGYARDRLDDRPGRFRDVCRTLVNDRVWQMKGPFEPLALLGGIHSGDEAVARIGGAVQRIGQHIEAFRGLG